MLFTAQCPSSAHVYNGSSTEVVSYFCTCFSVLFLIISVTFQTSGEDKPMGSTGRTDVLKALGLCSFHCMCIEILLMVVNLILAIVLLAFLALVLSPNVFD